VNSPRKKESVPPESSDVKHLIRTGTINCVQACLRRWRLKRVKLNNHVGFDQQHMRVRWQTDCEQATLLYD